MINLRSKVNIIYLTFAKQLSLFVRPTDFGAQKIDGTTLNIYRIVVAIFSVVDKANQVRFFEKTFLVANVSPKVVFKMLFLTLSGTDVDFLDWKFRRRTYTTKEALPTIRRVKLVGKKEFATATFDLEYEIYVVHIGSISSDVLPNFSLVHLFRRP